MRLKHVLRDLERRISQVAAAVLVCHQLDVGMSFRDSAELVLDRAFEVDGRKAGDPAHLARVEILTGQWEQLTDLRLCLTVPRPAAAERRTSVRGQDPC